MIRMMTVVVVMMIMMMMLMVMIRVQIRLDHRMLRHYHVHRLQCWHARAILDGIDVPRPERLASGMEQVQNERAVRICQILSQEDRQRAMAQVEAEALVPKSHLVAAN